MTSQKKQEAWYQNNLAKARTRLLAEQQIARLEASRNTFPRRAALEMARKSQGQLLAQVMNRRLRCEARNWSKEALIDWLIQDRLATIAQAIAAAQVVANNNQPDPRWRLRPGDSLEEPI